MIGSCPTTHQVKDRQFTIAQQKMHILPTPSLKKSSSACRWQARGFEIRLTALSIPCAELCLAPFIKFAELDVDTTPNDTPNSSFKL